MVNIQEMMKVVVLSIVAFCITACASMKWPWGDNSPNKIDENEQSNNASDTNSRGDCGARSSILPP